MIVLVTVPFLGHYNAMRNIANQFLAQNIHTLLIVVTWSNVAAPEESENRLLHENRVVIETVCALEDTNPTVFNWHRAKNLIPALLRRLEHSYVVGREIIDCVLYDFFCPEAYFVARALRLQSVCCIPAVPMQMQTSERIDYETIRSIELSENDGKCLPLAMISDFAFINDSREPKWLFAHPKLAVDIGFLGSNAKYIFAAKSLETLVCNTRRINMRKIYVCFGTVVTGNLWRNASTEWREKLILLYRNICDYCHRSKTECLVSIPGGTDAYDVIVGRLEKPYQHARFDCETYSFITWKKSVDQPAILQSGMYDAFITHGGGNSVSEALDCNIPLICVPFFGDQFVSAWCIANQHLGAAFQSYHHHMSVTKIVTTNECLENLALFDEKIAFIAKQLPLISNSQWLNSFEKQIGNSSQTRHTATDALLQYTEKSKIRWIDGDLLFGTSVDRADFCNAFEKNPSALLDAPDGFAFCFGRPFDAYSIHQKYPTLLDHYNDAVYVDKCEQAGAVANNQSLEAHTLISEYAKVCLLHQGRVCNMEKRKIASICTNALNFYLFQQKKLPRGSIHFVVGDDFSKNSESIAHAELQFILERCFSRFWFTFGHVDETIDLSSRVYFYIFTDKKHLRRVHVLDALNFDWSVPAVVNTLLLAEFLCLQIGEKMQLLLKKIAPTLGGALLEKRVKTRESLLRNFQERKRYISSDIIGFRIVHPFTSALYKIASELSANFFVVSRRVSERGRVIHLIMYDAGPFAFEVQLWPSVLHSCFLAEHDTVYKATVPLTDSQMEISQKIRSQQHLVQDAIDMSGPIVFL